MGRCKVNAADFLQGVLPSEPASDFASKWSIDAGLFVGGGGGGAAPQGGGLMLRPYLDISRDVGSVMLGAGVSYVSFPNGDIESTQLNLTLGIPFDIYYGRARDAGMIVSESDLFGLKVQESEWLATLGEYRPADSARTTANDEMTAALKWVGFEYRGASRSASLFFCRSGGGDRRPV